MKLKMKNILKENDSILYTREEMFLVLKEIEFILSSLHHMESYYYDRDKKEYEDETTRFINNSLVCSRLAAIRTILSIPFDKDLSIEEQEAIEDILLEETPSWEKPGDYCDDIWVEERASEVLAALDNPIEKIHIIQQLKNQKLVSIGRDGDFFEINFGAEIIEKDDYDNERKRGEYFLDFQCKWRIEDCQSKSIKLSSEDMYEPCFMTNRVEKFERNIPGNNDFDEKVMTLFPDNEEIQVKDVSLSENGDLELVFSNDLVLLCFAMDSLVNEWWRFYSHSNCDYFVVSGSNGKKEILAMMEEFQTNKIKTTIHLPEKFELYLNEYKQYLKEFNGGSGMIGEENYLILWSQDEIVEFNRDYAVEEFLPDILLIGSDGGEIAYGINSKCEYIQVPFIPMDAEEVSVIAGTFEEFIQYLYNR